MSKSCGVEFVGNPKKLCFSGQTVYARASVLIDKPTVIKQLYIKIRGTAKVYWNDLERDGHMDEILYIDEHIAFDGHKEFTLKPGRRTFDFQFTIPLGCPSSFESKRGRVRYTVSLVHRTNVLIKEKCIGFTVIKPLNLNTHSLNLAMPFCDDKWKKMWCGLLSKRLSISVKLHKTGFVPGEEIPVEVAIDNRSSTVVKKLSVKLVLRALHRTRTDKNTYKKKISLAKVKYTKRQIVTRSSFKQILPIPPTPPSFEGVCHIFDVAYSVDVTARLSGIHSKLTLKIPVVIGIVPLGVTEKQKSDVFSFQDYDMDLPEITEAPYMDPTKNMKSAEEYFLDAKFIPVYPKFFVKVKT